MIGGAGHITPRKGFDVLLRAFAAAVPRARLAILGDGAGVIAGLDVFVLSSHTEGMANVMLEAMTGGTPVIASDISGVRRAIASSGARPAAGWFAPPGDIDALAGGIRSACDTIRQDPKAVERLADEAHWRAENWFSPEQMVDECERILFAT